MKKLIEFHKWMSELTISILLKLDSQDLVTSLLQSPHQSQNIKYTSDDITPSFKVSKVTKS